MPFEVSDFVYALILAGIVELTLIVDEPANQSIVSRIRTAVLCLLFVHAIPALTAVFTTLVLLMISLLIAAVLNNDEGNAIVLEISEFVAQAKRFLRNEANANHVHT